MLIYLCTKRTHSCLQSRTWVTLCQDTLARHAGKDAGKTRQQHTPARHAGKARWQDTLPTRRGFRLPDRFVQYAKKRARLNVQAGAQCVSTKAIARGGTFQAEAVRIALGPFLGGQNKGAAGSLKADNPGVQSKLATPAVRHSCQGAGPASQAKKAVR